MQQDVKQHWIAATLLGLGVLSLVISFVILKTHADPTVTITASTSNVKPTAVINYVTNAASSTIESTSTTLVLTDDSAVSIHLKGTFTDDNGCTDVTTGGRINGMVYHGSADCSGGSESSHCFAATSCSLSSCSGATGQFDCTVPVWFNADPTGTGSRFADDAWNAVVMPLDATMISNNDSSGNISAARSFEIAELTAIQLSSGDLAFGNMNLDSTTSSIALTITNTGNKDDEGVAIAATAMTCTTGSIPASNIKFATNDVAYDSMTALHDDESAVSTGLSIAVSAASSTDMSSSTYFNLKTPASGVAGTCTGTLTFSTE